MKLFIQRKTTKYFYISLWTENEKTVSGPTCDVSNVSARELLNDKGYKLASKWEGVGEV